MIIAKEIAAPFEIKTQEKNAPLFVRIDIDKSSDIEQFLTLRKNDITGLLFKKSSLVHPSRWDQVFFSSVIEQHIAVAQRLVKEGCTSLVIAADEDGVLQKTLSPRFSSLDQRERMSSLLAIYAAVANIVPRASVLLTVEELAPGGMDATDGVAIARELYALGMKQIIATSGTRDFMPLYDRRMTKKKQSEHDDFISNQPSLASALWLLRNTKLEVWCALFIDDALLAHSTARSLGIAGLIEKAQINDI